MEKVLERLKSNLAQAILDRADLEVDHRTMLNMAIEKPGVAEVQQKHLQIIDMKNGFDKKIFYLRQVISDIEKGEFVI